MIGREHLRMLREIDRRGSVTAAAEALHLSQPALSHAIRKLEQQLGTPLWARQGRLVRFTRAGRYLVSVADRLLPQFERAEDVLQQIAVGSRGDLRIGMECHPCYQWLLKVVDPYLRAWPDVDVDVRQRFRFGGMAALLHDEIDILVTPDPLQKNGIRFLPVFNYEQVLVVARDHPYADRSHVVPRDLSDQVLLSYPVETDRQDIYSLFLTPAGYAPRQHKVIEATEIMLQMVAAGRGVAALPRWLVDEHARTLAIRPLRLGPAGIAKQIHLGVRDEDLGTPYLKAFLELAGSAR